MKKLAVIGAFLWPHFGFAFEPALPDATVQLADKTTADMTYALPVGVAENDQVPTLKLRGQVEQQSWRIDEGGTSPRAVMETLRTQVVEQGYEIMLDCPAQTCGGFGFRYAIDVLTPPDMFVDLAHFHFLSATKGEGEDRKGLAILTSRTALVGMVQITEITSGGVATSDRESPQTETVRPVQRPAPETAQTTDLISELQTSGHAVLEDLVFETGASALGEAEFASLTLLATWLRENPEIRVALVGHTDNTGAAETNLAVSQGRADAVLQRLTDVLEVPAAQLEARGLGYFAPVTSNKTPQGRDLNRRVEVVVVSTP
ncbi:cell envelope biogenesis protein OmpA [Rhodobacteraceae bacterium 4F10]|nr:cell envelope biogenesis protein OmpA [Rhodobacteraceae bacterium 4F10]